MHGRTSRNRAQLGADGERLGGVGGKVPLAADEGLSGRPLGRRSPTRRLVHQRRRRLGQERLRPLQGRAHEERMRCRLLSYAGMSIAPLAAM